MVAGSCEENIVTVYITKTTQNHVHYFCDRTESIQNADQRHIPHIHTVQAQCTVHPGPQNPASMSEPSLLSCLSLASLCRCFLVLATEGPSPLLG